MNFFDGRLFWFNKALFTSIGQWPFQSARVHFISLLVLFLLGGTNIIVKLIATISLGNNIEAIIDDMPPLMCDMMATIKLINNAVQMRKMKVILNRIEIDYSSITSDDELKIMHEFANNGKKFTFMYTGLFVITFLSFTLPPLQTIIVSYRNGTVAREYVHHTQYFVEPDNYYFEIIAHSYITIALVSYMIVSMDTLLVIIVQHACGLFTTLGHLLCNLTTDNGELVDFNASKKDDESFRNVSLCVRRHQEAIEFANLVESYYSTTFFVQIAVNMIGISIAGFQAVKTTDIGTFYQHISVLCTAVVHIFFECAFGQRLIDYSSRVHEYLIDVKWYQTSLRTRKIINLMIVRARYPCVLTAASMVVISMETFSAIMRTSMSYFTVLRSTQ